MSKKEKFLASAQKHLERGSLDKALGDYQKAAEDDPKDTRVWLKIAELQVKRGRKEDARDVYLKTAEIYTEQGFFQRAVAVYKNLLKLTPGFVDAHFKLADLFRQLGLLSDAMQQYEMAAAVYQKQGKVAEAMGAMRRIVDLNPDHVLARIKLAEAASAAGFKDEAVTAFRHAADNLRAQGRTDEFLRVAERLLSHAPGDLAFAKEVAAGYIERGNARFALAKLQPCFAADPRDLETLQLLARAFEQLGQVAKTLSVTKEMGRLHRDLGHKAESIAAFQRALALDPSDEEARTECARAQSAPVARAPVREVSHASHEASITFSEMAIPQFLLPRDSSPSMPAVFAASSSGSESAQPSGRAAIPSLHHADVERLLSEADLFIKYNLFDRAVEHVRRVFDLAPDHVGGRERLAFAFVQMGRLHEAATQYALLGEQFRFADPSRAQVYMKQAAATRPEGTIGDPATESGNQPEFTMVSEDSSGEVLDFDALDAELIEDDVTPTPSAPSSVLSLSELATSAQVRSDKHAKPAAANRDQDDDKDEDWAPPTSEMTLPSFDEFDRVERTSAEGFSEAALSADLEQVDFFLAEALADEAQSLLDDLVTRYPRHPAVIERLARLRDLSSRGAVPQNPSTAAELSEPRAVMQKGESSDAGTHADLGIAYKEMGLYDAAIKEFKLLAQDPKREIQALAMMGECYESKGALPDAVIHYKKALNRSHITADESTQIYFQLGRVFEALGDGKEALYFFDKVIRRNGSYADVGARINRLRGGTAGPPTNPLAGADSGSVNDALDVISGGSHRSRS